MSCRVFRRYPNFQSWAGWVRDILKSGARRIFLVGLLNLSQAKRRFLEKQNIVPIDLSKLDAPTGVSKHEWAYSRFFSLLNELKPQAPDEWELESTSEYQPNDADSHQKLRSDGVFAKPHILKAIEVWGKERQRFPGWLVAPTGKRMELRFCTDGYRYSSASLSELDAGQKASFLEELSWRYNRQLLPLPEHFGSEILAVVEGPNGWGIISEDLRYDVCEALLRSKYVAKGRDELMKLTAKIEAQKPFSDFPILASYMLCTAARDALDTDYLGRHISAIDTDKSDPVWSLRKAGLLFWLGKNSDAASLIHEAVAELRRSRRGNPNSMWVQSRLSWALWIKQGLRFEVDDSPDETGLLRTLSQQNGCDVDRVVQHFRNEFDEGLRKRSEVSRITPTFDSDAYKDNRNTITIGGPAWATAYYGFFFAMETTGVPYRSNHVDFSASLAQKAIELADDQDLNWYLKLLSCYPSYDGKPINRYFSRIAVAKLDAKLVKKLSERVTENITHWRSRVAASDEKFDTYAIERLRLFVEVLARISIRFCSDKAIESYDLAVDLAQDKGLHHFWLFQPIGNLAKNSFIAVEKSDRHQLSNSILGYPLCAETDASVDQQWPNAETIGYPSLVLKSDKSFLRRRVGDFLKLMENDTGRTEAALRLTYLFENKLLTKPETLKFGKLLWNEASKNASGLPGGTNLYPHVFASLPHPEKIEPKQRVKDTLFSIDSENKSASVLSRVEAISFAAQDRRGRIFPTEEAASELFEVLTTWRPEPPNRASGLLNFDRSERQLTKRFVGEALSYAVVPTLANHKTDTARSSSLLSLVEDVNLVSALSALVWYVDTTETFAETVSRQIRGAITSHDHSFIHHGVMAATLWLDRHAMKKTKAKFPNRLKKGLLKALYQTPDIGLASLLYCARRVCKYGHLNKSDVAEIIELLDDLRASLDYQNIGHTDPRAIGTPLARIECIRLAKALKDNGESNDVVDTWLTQRANDPLPEVRNMSFDEV